MIFFDLKLLLTTTSILFIASVECCVYSTDLIKLGHVLLKHINETEFNNYAAIQNFKNSIKFALKSSIVATPYDVLEAIVIRKGHTRKKSLFTATDTIIKFYDTVFSLVKPNNTYKATEVRNTFNRFSFKSYSVISTSVYRELFGDPLKIKKLVEAYHTIPRELHCKHTTSVHHKVAALHNRAILNLIMSISTMLYLNKKVHPSWKKNKLYIHQLPTFLLSNYGITVRPTQGGINKFAKNAARHIYRCDPTEHEHEKTYDRLYDLVEYYVTSERFLNENNQCSATPKNYHGIKHSFEIENYIDGTIRCHGTLYQCDIVNLKHLFLYGEDDIYRRYHGFSVADPQSPDGEKLHGNIGDATVAFTSDDLNGIGENSPNHPYFNLTSNELDRLKQCPIYGCYCDNYDSPRTVRYFSTKLVTSSVHCNRVITGLRLKVQGRVLYIQAQTGHLVGLGVVDPASVKWEEIETVDVTGVAEKSPNAEFVKLDYNSRSLYLDDLSIDEGYYLTGVQFIRANRGVRIAAHFTPYDGFTLITHLPPATLQASDIDRTERKLDHSKILKDMLNLNSKPISVQNRDYVKFQPSDIENDAGQTTVPFLDIQPVVTNPPTALGGFGIYLKGNPGSGSFVALKLLSTEY